MTFFTDRFNFTWPFQTAKDQRALIQALLTVKNFSPNENQLKSIEILLKLLQEAKAKRKKAIDDVHSSYSEHSPKSFDQVEDGLYCLTYGSKKEEQLLLEKCRSLIESMAEKTTALSEEEEEHRKEEIQLALKKYKPRSIWFLFYLGKLFAFATALGAGFCGAMVAIFLTSGLGWPAALVTLAGVAIFLAHFILEIVLNRYTTPKHLVNLWQGGFLPKAADPKVSHIRLKTFLPMIFALGSAAQVATLTFVSTKDIVTFMSVASTLTLSSFLALFSLVTIGCLLFNSSYTIYRAPQAWWHKQRQKIDPNYHDFDKKLKSTELNYRRMATILTLGICTAALVFYCHTIILIAFADAITLGWILAIGFNIPAMIPFVIDKSFDIAKTVCDQTMWLVNRYFPKEPQGIQRWTTLTGLVFFTLLVAATLPVWASATVIKKGLQKLGPKTSLFSHSTTEPLLPNEPNYFDSGNRTGFGRTSNQTSSDTDCGKMLLSGARTPPIDTSSFDGGDDTVFERLSDTDEEVIVSRQPDRQYKNKDPRMNSGDDGSVFSEPSHP